jgi:P-type Mg2+ transporter
LKIPLSGHLLNSYTLKLQRGKAKVVEATTIAPSAPSNGVTVSVPIDQLVPGDIVELIAGDLVPADWRLIESRDLFINEALLTGEPYPVEKEAGDAAALSDPGGASNAVFAGTSVISGTATILVCRTGTINIVRRMISTPNWRAPTTKAVAGGFSARLIARWPSDVLAPLCAVGEHSFSSARP